MPDVHPVSSWQNRMIQTCGHPACSDVFHDRMLIRFALQITPRVDLRRLSRAFEKLILRHDTIRIRFVEIDGEWKASIADRHPYGLQAREFGDVDDQFFEAAVNRIAAEPLSVFADSLIELLILNFGKRGDVLVVRVHHAVIDGYGMIVMIEELLKCSVGLPILKSAMTHADYVKNWDADEFELKPDNLQYWENKILPVIPPLDFGRRRKGIAPLEDRYKLESTIGYQIPARKKSLAKLAVRAGTSGVTLHNYVLAAFADVIYDQAGSDEVYIAVLVGRYDHHLDTFIGNHSKLILVRYGPGNEWTIDQKAIHVAEEMREGIVHLPTTAFSRGGRIHRAFSEARNQMLLFFAHVPEAVGRANRSPFSHGFLAGLNNEPRLGSLSHKRFQLRPKAHTTGELQIDLLGTRDGYSLELSADGYAFSEGELAKFGEALMMKLDLE